MKRLLVILGVILVLLVGSLAAFTLLIDPNRFRPLLESELSTALGREVHLGDLKLALWSGSVTANDLSIADDPAYSKAPFVKAKSLGIAVEMWPLITSRKLHVTGLTIDQPVIALIQGPSGRMEFFELGRQSQSNAHEERVSRGEEGGSGSVGETGAH